MLKTLVREKTKTAAIDRKLAHVLAAESDHAWCETCGVPAESKAITPRSRATLQSLLPTLRRDPVCGIAIVNGKCANALDLLGGRLDRHHGRSANPMPFPRIPQGDIILWYPDL
jgi:hypothetical protein